MANLASTTISGTITEKKGTASVSGTTLTVDMSTGNYFEVSLTPASGNIATFTITNPPASGNVGSFVIKITQVYPPGSTVRSFNWDSMAGARPEWEGTPPVMPTDINAQDVYTFTTYDGGTTWYGSTIGTEFNSVSIFGNRGVFCGGDYETSGQKYGYAASEMDSDKIDYVNIDTPGNAITFGVMSQPRGYLAACSDGQRGVMGGGRRYNYPSAPTHTETNFMDYITIGTPGGSTGFGTLTVTRQSAASTSSPTRGIFAGGYVNPSPTYYNTIDYITIVTPANAADFGDMLSGTLTVSQRAACSSGTRAVLAGGKDGSGSTLVMDYYTFDHPGNGTNFGNLTTTNRAAAGTSDGSRGIIAGGSRGDANQEKIDYITIATPATAGNFGDLTREHYYLSGTSNGTRGVFGGGWKDMVSYPPPPNQIMWASKTIDYITIATTGNATDFGDLTSTRDTLAAVSGN